MGDPLNWSLAARLGGVAVRPGPVASRLEAQALVTELRAASQRAIGYVEEITGLTAASLAAAAAPVLVVDRPGFIRANTQMVAALTNGALDGTTGWAARQVGGAQAGLVLAALASRVLGQFDPFGCGDTAPGRLLLVAPNVMRFERELDVDTSDFRLWVTLHEQTHAVQFAAAPWLRGHLTAKLEQIMGEDADGGVLTELIQAVRNLPKAMRDEAGPTLATGVLTPRGRIALAEATAAMSLLEGHADVIMDAVGPRVVRSIEQIRPKFDARRVAGGRLERAIRRLAGMDVKTAQYIQGAAFVRAVLAAVGHEGLNAAFAAPENLPDPAEIDHPAAWLARVHG